MASPQNELMTDYSLLPQLAEARREENDLFKSFLKKFPSSHLDKILQPIANSVTERIDCTQCGNCCRHLEPGITEEEAGILASLKSMPKQVFIRNFTQREAGTETLFMNHQPCIFFDGKLCNIYHQRPASCKDFPHLAKENFKFRYHSIMANYAICPIVFNSIEELKRVLNFHSA